MLHKNIDYDVISNIQWCTVYCVIDDNMYSNEFFFPSTVIPVQVHSVEQTVDA